MKTGRNLALLPGGFEEAALYRHNQYDVYIKSRKGFIKYALQNGYQISPVFSFGEEATYFSIEAFPKLRLALARLQIPGIVFWSKLGIFPNPDIDIVTVVGDPLQFPTIQHPTHDEIDEFHSRFIEALQSLFEKYKVEYARNPKADLNLF